MIDTDSITASFGSKGKYKGDLLNPLGLNFNEYRVSVYTRLLVCFVEVKV